MDVWLASNSPRRFALLQPMFVNVHHEGLPNVDETPPSGTVEEQVLSICQRKARAITSTKYDVVVVADTMLSDPDDHSLSLGKPKDLAHAAMMLHRLSGRHHQVWTATGIRWNGAWRFWCESAVVAIASLTDAQLSELLESGSWKGKAGGYDLHGAMGQHATVIDGEASTVLGLAGEAMELLGVLAGM